MSGNMSLGLRRTGPPRGGNWRRRLSKASVSLAIGAGAMAAAHADPTIVLPSGLPVQVKPTFSEPGLPAFSFPTAGSSSLGGSSSSVDDSGGNGREQTKLADLAHGDSERGGDGFLGPVLGRQAFDGAPEIDRRHGSAHDIFADRAHVIVLAGIFAEDVDLLEARIDRKADAAGAVDDRERAMLFRDGWGLEDADGLDAGGKRCVRHFAGLDFSGIAGIFFEVRGSTRRSSISFLLVSPHREFFSMTKPGERGRSGRGKGGASVPGSDPLERQRRGRTHSLRRTGGRA